MISWAMLKLGVEEWLVLAVMSTYRGAETVVRTVFGNSKFFQIKVRMHQGSPLSPLLFVIEFPRYGLHDKAALPLKQLYADDLAVIAKTEEELIKRLNKWKDTWREEAWQ